MYLDTVIPGVQYLDISIPPFAQFELTPGCPYRCRMCYNVWKGTVTNGPILTKLQQFQVIDQLDRIFSLIFSGGEPTTIPWLEELVSYATKKGIQTSLITIAAGMTLERARALRNAGLGFVQVSFHHFMSESNDLITGKQGSYDLTLSGATNLLKVFGSENMGINMVVNNDTANDVYETGKLLYALGFRAMSVGVLSQSGAALANGLKLDSFELNKACQQLQKLADDLGMRVGLTGGVPFCALKDVGASVKIHNICDAGIDQIVIGPDGNCRPCVEWPFSAGNILQMSLVDIWQSEVFRIPREFRDVPESCYPCVYVSRCRGGCRASAFNSTNMLQGADPLMPPQGSLISVDNIEIANKDLLAVEYDVEAFPWKAGTYEKFSNNCKIQHEYWGGIIQVEPDGWATLVKGREVLEEFINYVPTFYPDINAIPSAVRTLISLGLLIKV